MTVMRNVKPFFPVHDLTHYAVECTLRHRRGFYGLVCEGWNFDDFGTPWPRGPLPPERDPSEMIVGLLDLERATGHEMTLEDLNAHMAAKRSEAGEGDSIPLTQGQLDTIRARVLRHAAHWSALAPGDTLVLDYTPGEDSDAC